jgi:arginyl-tRNA synthetase
MYVRIRSIFRKAGELDGFKPSSLTSVNLNEAEEIALGKKLAQFAFASTHHIARMQPLSSFSPRAQG